MEEIDYMKIQCRDCNELDEIAMKCKHFMWTDERRCFVDCIMGRKVREPIEKGFDSFDISFGGEVT